MERVGYDGYFLDGRSSGVSCCVKGFGSCDVVWYCGFF